MNIDRKIKKSRKIWDYHYFKWSYKKSLYSYLRALTYAKLCDIFNETLYLQISYCYYMLEKYEESLYYANEWLKISWGYYDLLLRKAYTLDKMWRKEESEVLFSKINKIDDEISNMELDLNKFYKS